ncbi:MAG: family 16 glycosylhydrolase [Bacteroidales bacterium]|jgi:beta-glucanase (GH16 family)|nr:family 16 glycosylhydrolase [Bacteroidales bacterium]
MKNSLLQTIFIIVFVTLLYGCPAETPDAPDITKDGITSGRVNTDGKFAFKYGRVDASIKLPKTANGLWPAFWMLGVDFGVVGWPLCGEIDVLEMGSREGIDNAVEEKLFSGAAHWGTLAANGSHPNYALSVLNDYSLQDDNFHLYTLKWNENSIAIYLDLDKYPQNAPYYVMDISVDGVGEYFHKEFFILFNLAVGGDFPRIYDMDGVTALHARNDYLANMYIDFVKVYDEAGNLLWEDVFEDSTLDMNKWNIEENDFGGGNNELQTYSHKNVSITTEPKSGKRCLTITAKRSK